ncbi:MULTISPECIES: Cof-type HAD-IIB family hydrolase [unclassified Mycoplasma]
MSKIIKPVIFSDMDGTLYGKDFVISKDTKQDINFAIHSSEENLNPGDFNLATGNPYFERVAEVCQQLGVRFAICSSGAQIFDVQNQEFVYERYIDVDKVKQIINVIKENKWPTTFFNSNKYYYLNISDNNFLDYVTNFHFTNKEQKSIISEYKDESLEEIVKIEIWAERAQERNQIAELLRPISEDVVVGNFVVEVTPNNVSKASGIEFLQSTIYTQHSFEDFMAVGDSGNDVSMLSLCGFSYAMANGDSKIKKLAHFHTSSVEQNGLGEAIIDYLYRFDNIVKKFLLH